MAGKQRIRIIIILIPFSSLLFPLLVPVCVGGPARAPLLAGKPFLVLWGVPDKDCLGRPDPASFGMEREGRVANFYEDMLGRYPYFAAQERPVNGGLPQHTSLNLHLEKVAEDLTVLLPQAGSPGLGVLHWQEWAPQWSRNRGAYAKYSAESRALLRGFFPDWTPEEVEKWSQVDFEAAAQSILMETLREVKKLRPQRLWGVASYPNCYNFDSTKMALVNYTGRCPAAEMALNDELMWLWKHSGALYPVLSLEKLPEGTKGSWLYATNQIREALRVAALAGTSFDLPVFPLVKTAYAVTEAFLSESDLVSTIGESAAMGASGVIIWEKSIAVKTQKSCSEFGSFVRQVLGPYAVNVTTAAHLCGVSLCKGRGRCVRKKPEEPSYLHLPAGHFMLLTSKAEGARATGLLPPASVDLWRKDFRCQWFEALEGAAADQESVAVLEKGMKVTPSTFMTIVGISPSTDMTPVPPGPVDSRGSTTQKSIILLCLLVLMSFIMVEVQMIQM